MLTAGDYIIGKKRLGFKETVVPRGGGGTKMLY